MLLAGVYKGRWNSLLFILVRYQRQKWLHIERNSEGISSWFSVVLDLSVENHLLTYLSGKITEMKGLRKSYRE